MSGAAASGGGTLATFGDVVSIVVVGVPESISDVSSAPAHATRSVSEPRARLREKALNVLAIVAFRWL